MSRFEEINERTIDVSMFLINNRTTIRKTAKHFGVSKSTVHKDIAERLLRINPGLYAEAKEILEHNKNVRHIRGGQATKINNLRRRSLNA